MCFWGRYRSRLGILDFSRRDLSLLPSLIAFAPVRFLSIRFVDAVYFRIIGSNHGNPAWKVIDVER